MEYNKREIGNIRLHTIKTNKFKNIIIDVKIGAPFEVLDIEKRSLLPYVLKAASQKYKSKEAISKKLELLYGAGISVSTSRQGNLSVMNFTMKIINEKFIKNKGLFEEALKFLREIILNPLAKDGHFSRGVVNEEKRLLLEEIEALKEDKGNYAYTLFNKEMFKNELQRYRSIGEAKNVKKVNNVNLYEYYLKCIKDDSVDVLIVGDVSDTEYLVSKYLDFGTKKDIAVLDYETKIIKKVKEVTKYDDIKQSHLIIGYRTNIRADHELHIANVVLNTILGGYQNSLLFMNVREKASLAYAVMSKNNALKGFIYIWAGIDGNKKEEAKQIIIEQVSKIKNGDFSEKDIDGAKAYLISGLYETLDSMRYISQKAYNDTILNRNFDIDKMIEDFQKVTKKDIIKASKMLKLDTVFYLLGDDKHAEN